MDDNNSSYVLSGYRDLIGSLSKVDSVAADVLAILGALEDAAEGPCRPEVVGAFARAARSLLNGQAEAMSLVHDAADVLFQHVPTKPAVDATPSHAS